MAPLAIQSIFEAEFQSINWSMAASNMPSDTYFIETSVIFLLYLTFLHGSSLITYSIELFNRYTSMKYQYSNLLYVLCDLWILENSIWKIKTIFTSFTTQFNSDRSIIIQLNICAQFHLDESSFFIMLFY